MPQSPREIFELQQRLNKILREFIKEIQTSEEYPSAVIPNMDILITEHEILVLMDAPGMNGGNIRVSFSNGILRIEGEKKWVQLPGKKYHLLERTFGSFFRTVHISEAVNAMKAIARINNGVLEIHLPRTEEKRKKVFEIHVEE